MDREKVIKDLEECMTASCRGYRPRLSCPYNDEEWDIMHDALALLKEQEQRIKELESIKVTATDNGTAIGAVHGGLVIQKGQNNKHIVNNGTMTMTFGK